MRIEKTFLKRLGSIFFLMLFLVVSFASKPSPSRAETVFSNLAQDYFSKYYFPENPATATTLGNHRYDNTLADDSKANIMKKIMVLQKYEADLKIIDPKALSDWMEANYELLINHLHSELLNWQEIKAWEKNPDYYSSLITQSAFVLMERDYAPAALRLRSLIAREKAMPRVLTEARKNLKNPPKIYTEIALEQLPGIVRFFQSDVPLAFVKVKDQKLQKQFFKSNAAVIVSLKAYQQWLKDKLLPLSQGDFRIGKTLFLKKLQYDEMVDLSLEQLQAINLKNMQENQNEFQRISKELYPNKNREEALLELVKNHPNKNAVLKTFSDQFSALIQFIKDKKIITLPSEVRPLMEETPPFMRAITLASMDTPGPFERKAKEAYFNVTLPGSSWSQEKENSLLEMFNYPAISSIAVHEAYPGHYVQFLWIQKISDPIRKIIGASSNAEGWAHYCEQMMLDEGFVSSSSDPKKEAQLLRLGQLSDALLRNARFTVGIKLHTGQMTYNEAIDFFVKEGYQPRLIAIIETKRGTMDPTYLYYTLGKLQILKLRADLEKKEGSSFSLEKFHNDFMQQGFPPVKIVRRALLRNNSPTLDVDG